MKKIFADTSWIAILKLWDQLALTHDHQFAQAGFETSLRY
jgi:hypothetical protein